VITIIQVSALTNSFRQMNAEQEGLRTPHRIEHNFGGWDLQALEKWSHLPGLNRRSADYEFGSPAM
jgi:hypothetical protein